MPAHVFWQQPMLVDAIADSAQEQDLAALRATCVILAQAVDRPTLWARRYAPCRIDFANHRILTSLHLCRSDTDRGEHAWRLGSHAGHVWHLLSGYRPAMPDDAALTALVDEGTALMRRRADVDGLVISPLINMLLATEQGDRSHTNWRLLVTMGYRFQTHTSHQATLQWLQPLSLARNPGCMLGALAVWVLATVALRYHDARSIDATMPSLCAVAIAASSSEAATLLVVVTCLAMHMSQVRAEQAETCRLQAVATTLYRAAVAAG